MHSCQDIEENRCFSNGGTNLHIHPIAQGRPEDNQVEFLQGPHGIVNTPKNLVLNNIRRFTMEHIGAANGLITHQLLTMLSTIQALLPTSLLRCFILIISTLYAVYSPYPVFSHSYSRC